MYIQSAKESIEYKVVIANGRTTVQQRQTDQNLNIKTETNHFDR